MAWSLLALPSTVKQGLHKELYLKDVNYFNLCFLMVTVKKRILTSTDFIFESRDMRSILGLFRSSLATNCHCACSYAVSSRCF